MITQNWWQIKDLEKLYIHQADLLQKIFTLLRTNTFVASYDEETSELYLTCQRILRGISPLISTSEKKWGEIEDNFSHLDVTQRNSVVDFFSDISHSKLAEFGTNAALLDHLSERLKQRTLNTESPSDAAIVERIHIVINQLLSQARPSPLEHTKEYCILSEYFNRFPSPRVVDVSLAQLHNWQQAIVQLWQLLDDEG